MGDGLDELDNKRASRGAGRTMPPPRNPPRVSPVQVPHAEPAAAPRTVRTAPQAPQQSPPDRDAPTHTENAAPTLEKSSIYLDPHNDDFLEDIRVAGRRSKPKVDASRSAVVRLALRRLSEQMKPEQVVGELLARATPHTGEGRRRL